MSIIHRIKQLYRTNTKPQYTRFDSEVENRDYLDPDVKRSDVDPKYTLPEEQQDNLDSTILGSIAESYFTPDFHVHTNEEHHNPDKDKIPKNREESLLKTHYTGVEQDSTLENDDNTTPQYVPSAVVDYFSESAKRYPSQVLEYYNGSLNEAAMKAKQRNALDDSEFGLPRLRAYPLNDAKHVKAAIRMFNHCKDPEDQKTLASNILRAMKKYNVDMKIGENNKLYQYVPESLRESSYPKMIYDTIGKPMDKRSKADIIKEHLRINSDFFNNAFYGQEYANCITMLDSMEFLDVFYPNVRSMAYGNRIHTTIGGTYAGGKYDPKVNWFKADLSGDEDHIGYCCKLYRIMDKMLLDEYFDPRTLMPEEMGIILDWNPRVSYHYGAYKNADNEAIRTREIQYLWDLFWNYNENPDDPHVRSINVIAFVSQMRAVNIEGKLASINEDQLVGRQELRSYLEKDLGQSDSIYLLPKTKDFPIIDQVSVRLAMDKIGAVPKKDRKEFARNLNRRYRELGCDFSISIDHPYAKYASDDVVKRMTNVLMEDSSLPVDDESHADEDKANREAQPYYRRADVSAGSIWHNILDNKEMGPNNLKQQRPDYQAGEALL